MTTANVIPEAIHNDMVKHIAHPMEPLKKEILVSRNIQYPIGSQMKREDYYGKNE